MPIRKGFLPLSVSLVLLSYITTTQAQNQSFQEFRNEILNNYSDFKNTLLDQYADFLNGEWHEYQSLKGETRYKTPKPEKIPVVNPENPESSPENPISTLPSDSRLQPKANTKPSTQPKISPQEVPQTVAPSQGQGHCKINFFDIPLTLPKVEFNIKKKLTSTSDYADQWKKLADIKVAEKVLPGLKKLTSSLGLNDYLTYLLTKSYIESKFPDKDDSSRFSAVHYLLANMGYDVRIATTLDGIPLLLIPFDRMVYGRNYMILDGKNYYIFAPESVDQDLSERLGRILTCNIPDNLDKGKEIGLIIGELNLPYNPHQFELSGGRLTLKGEVNGNLMPILYRYPQMDIESYAMSNLQPTLRKDLIKQIKEQLGDLSDKDAVNALLQFTQNAFRYSTDEDSHGFEKPYFLEETLYYPSNDCEDRAIFYTYFLFNALAKKAQLISFPGHEAASVALNEPIEGASYNYEGIRYYVSDPTYIGSKTGMIMPSCKGEPMTIDYSYE